MTRSASGAVIRAILLATLVAGALDIGAAILTNPQVPARAVLQSVAGGWLGAETYSGGWTTAWLGLASHFALMLWIVTIYVALASLWPGLNRFWPAAGVVWGIVVWAVMSFAVVPLSASTLPAPDLTAALKGVAIHILFVGLPIAGIVRHFLGPRSAA